MSDVVSDGQDVVVAELKSDALASLTSVLFGTQNSDSYIRQRVSEPSIEFEFNAYNDILFSSTRCLFSKTETSGATITHSSSNKSYVLTSGTTNGAAAVAQQNKYNHCVPGISQPVILTFLFGSRVTNTVKKIGYFDANDGIYVEQDGTNEYICLKNSISATTERIAKGSWSTETNSLDFSKIQNVVIDYQYFGMIRIGFLIDNKILNAYTFYNSNTDTVLQFASPSLPIRWEITNTAGSAGSTMSVYAGCVFSEGISNRNNLLRSLYSAKTAGVNAGTTETGILAIRPANTFLSQNNTTTLYPVALNLFTETRAIEINVIVGSTITGGAWASANANSAAEYNATMTGFSGGIRVATFYAYLNTVESINLDFLGCLSRNLSGTLDVLLVTAKAVSNNATVRCALSWDEVYR